MSIRIIICFVILCFLPLASASTIDNVWTARSSGFIGSNESLSFENYMVKSKILDGTKATISVYKDQTRIDISDFTAGQFKNFGNIGVALLEIKGDYSWISISKLENKEVWRPTARTILKWGEKYTIDNYTIDFDTFGPESVNLRVSNKSMVETNFFSKDVFRDYGSLRIAVRDINRTGFIELEFLSTKVPPVKVEISTDKDEYFPDETIQVMTKVTSDAVQNVAGITLGSYSPVEVKPERFSATGLMGTNSFHSQITKLPVNSTVTINARIETHDYYNNKYIITVSKDIYITPVVSIIKHVQTDTDDENVPVELYVYNSGPSSSSIHIHDTIPEELTAKELDWNIELGPKNSTALIYYITPEKPGLYLLPAAVAQWNGQSATSRRGKVVMHMPSIDMTKTAVDNESVTDVRLAVRNTGDRPAQVEVSDKVPDGVSIISGDTTWSGKLEGGESVTIKYSLQGNIETLPAASATYRDIRGVIRKAQSNIVQLEMIGTGDNIDNNEDTILLNAKHEILSFMALSFISIAGVISGGMLIVYLLTKLKKR